MEINFNAYKPKEGHILVLKSLPADLVAAREHVEGGFKWPEKGKVTAPDWNERRWCGNGLHGWKWGTGDASLRVTDDDAKWLVLSVKEADIVELDGKIKFPTCQILYLGDRETAVKIIQHYAPAGTSIMFSTVTGGDHATVTGGDHATVAGGYRATVTGGYRATVTGGYGATVTGGYGATVTGGDHATVTGGDHATVTGGDGATVTGGYGATVTGGDHATVTGGDGATVTGGYGATVTGGDGATVTGGYGALLMFHFQQWVDGKGYEWKRKMAIVDGVNYLPGVKYRLLNDEIVPAPDQNKGE